MKGLNEAKVIWTIWNDLELKKTPSWTSVLSFSMATNESYTNEAWEKIETTDWHNIVVWSKAAEIIAQYLTKGSKLYVCWKMRTRSWDKDDGSKWYKTEIIVKDFVFLDSNSGWTESEPKVSETKTKSKSTKKRLSPEEEISISDIPF